PMRAHVRAAVEAGIPTVAECAGLLYLCRSVAGPDGQPAAMAGALGADAAMAPRLTLGYRGAVAPADGLLGAAGTRVTGHEFHRTALVADAAATSPDAASQDADSSTAAASPDDAAWLLTATGPAARPRPDGFATPT